MATGAVLQCDMHLSILAYQFREITLQKDFPVKARRLSCSEFAGLHCGEP